MLFYALSVNFMLIYDFDLEPKNFMLFKNFMPSGSLASTWCEFLLRGVSEHILVFVAYLFLFNMVSWGRRRGVQLW